MEIKVSETTNEQLNWLVATIEGDKFVFTDKEYYAAPASSVLMFSQIHYADSWAQGGPIIEREKINLASPNPIEPCWTAMNWLAAYKQDGPTPLIAAMRCYVVSKLGETVDIPKELL